MMNRNNKPQKRTITRLSRTGVDLGASRNAARDAMAEMRERRVKYGRISINRGNRDEPIRADKRGR